MREEFWTLTGEYSVLGQAASGRSVDLAAEESYRAVRVQMNDGRRFEVPHADLAALSPRGEKLFIFRNDNDDAGIHLSALLIASFAEVDSRINTSANRIGCPKPTSANYTRLRPDVPISHRCLLFRSTDT